jgi:hypothetical protein
MGKELVGIKIEIKTAEDGENVFTVKSIYRQSFDFGKRSLGKRISKFFTRNGGRKIKDKKKFFDLIESKINRMQRNGVRLWDEVDKHLQESADHYKKNRR